MRSAWPPQQHRPTRARSFTSRRLQSDLARQVVAADEGLPAIVRTLDVPLPALSASLRSGPAAPALGPPDKRGAHQVELVGGLDVSYDAPRPTHQDAVATYVLVRLADLTVLHTLHEPFVATEPYRYGYLAFRESPVFQRLLARAQAQGAAAEVRRRSARAWAHSRLALPVQLRAGWLPVSTLHTCAGRHGGRLWRAAPEAVRQRQPCGRAGPAGHHRRGQEPHPLGRRGLLRRRLR